MESDQRCSQSELIALYQNSTAKIEFYKRQQWYVLLLYSAVVAASVAWSLDKNKIPHFLFAILPVFAVIGVILAVFQYRCSIQRERNRLGRIYEMFSKEFTSARGGGDVSKDDSGDVMFYCSAVIYTVLSFVWAEVVMFWEIIS